ncbi:MAG: hypothetical protein FWG30_08620 [Eubacteriaceae bacterium]|nr:hypothetical protein [Eubacteriaceae bacterium]
MDNINTFIKEKLKQKKIKVDTLVQMTGASKSSIYRVLRGEQKLNEDLTEKISAALNLSDLEIKELRYYGSLAISTENTAISGKDAIINLLYSLRYEANEPVELVYFYDNERYFRTFSEILRNIAGKAGYESFSCNIRVINCCHESIISSLNSFVGEVAEFSDQYTIKHLVNLPNADFSESIEVLYEVMPLLLSDNYLLYYTGSESNYSKGMLSDFLIVEYEYLEQGDTVSCVNYIAILDNSLSVCYVDGGNSMLNEFFERSYDALFQDYKLAVDNRKKFEVIGYYVEEMETTYDAYLFKPNPCYNRIPLSVFQSVENRAGDDMKNAFVQSYFKEYPTADNTQDDLIESLLKSIKTRNEASRYRRQVDVYTKKGLVEFAKTGRLSDHMVGLPHFNKDEIRAVFENILHKDQDAKDLYCFYILDDGYSNDEILVTALKGHGIVIERTNPKYDANDYTYCIFQHAQLSEAFSDFAENYVPAMMAIPKHDAISFIEQLIKAYC